MTIRPDNFVLFPGYIFHDILDAAGIAPGPDVVGRVRDLAADVAGISRRLDASERDRVGLLATVETLRGERNKHSLTIQKCHTALTEAGARQGDVVDRLKALVADARILALSNDGYRNDIAKLRADLSAIAAAVGWRMDDDCTALEMARRVREERDALRALARPDVGLPEGWSTSGGAVSFGDGATMRSASSRDACVSLVVEPDGKIRWMAPPAPPAVYAHLLRAAGVAP